MTTAGSCTVIDGNDSHWHQKTHKLYSKNEIGNVPGHYLHFDGSLLKADGDGKNNGEKKESYGVKKIARQRYHTLSFGFREYSRKNL